MATLVLSTVGTLLGGPVGGAIGSLVGQSIDQQIFGSPRHGPRLGDLAVQTSSYGTQIARIYGIMRVAGSIVWATDLVESSQTSGAKGQPDQTFSYSVSFAVALSSRPLIDVRRIWADGKLLRGAAGDFKVSTGFRFYGGGEDQAVDPLIASIEGIEATPAYRGLAVAVFENLELAEFGNRIPFLTFEVVADETVTLDVVLNDASRGAIACEDLTAVGGYAATGSSIRSAVAPLVDTFAIDLVDDGSMLQSPIASGPVSIAEDDLGSAAESKSPSRMEREQVAMRTLPSSVQLTFYDPEREYQTGQSQSDLVDRSATEEKIEVPAVLTASDARMLAEQVMARRWAHRDKLTVHLPPKFLSLEPGARLDVPGSSVLWEVARSTIDGMATVLELRPKWRSEGSISGDAGRALPAADAVIENVSLALVELPDMTGRSGLTPTVYLAATSSSSNWKAFPVEIGNDHLLFTCRASRRKSLLGSAVTALADGPVGAIDEVSLVDVQLIDPNQWLTSCDEDALQGGANLALIGDEIVQFAGAEAIGPARFRLTRFLRGRFSTEGATSTHSLGDLFLMIDPSLVAIALPASAVGSTITASCESVEDTTPATLVVDGRSLATGLYVAGEQVVGTRAGAISSPTGGTTIDAEARTVVSQILGALRTHGLIDM